jgi:short-subunit dehydrogenase involved in D-alanine esterification of teichoic acids
MNNAGVNRRGDGLPGAADLGVVQKVFDTNFFGAIRVVQAMLPLLRKSAAGRIVNVSSGLGSLALNSDPSWSITAVNADRQRSIGSVGPRCSGNPR